MTRYKLKHAWYMYIYNIYPKSIAVMTINYNFPFLCTKRKIKYKNKQNKKKIMKIIKICPNKYFELE